MVDNDKISHPEKFAQLCHDHSDQFVYFPGKCKNTTAIAKGKRKKSIDLEIFLSIMYYFYYDIGAITVSTNKCQNWGKHNVDILLA